jgi:TonB family protein
MRVWAVAAVCCWCSLAFADESARIVARVATPDGKPLGGVTFLAISAEGVQKSAVSPRTGEISLTVTPGRWALVAVLGGEKAQVQLELAPGATESRGFVFAGNEGEVITIEEHVGPSKAADPELQTPMGKLPYTDEAVEQNVHGVVWLLVDIDVEGKPDQVTVLKSSPEVGLGKIAVQAAMRLRFSPARNAAGQPIRKSVVIVLEWPPYWGRAAGFSVHTNCKGEGPMQLDIASNHAVGYVDCDPPPGFGKRIQLGKSYRDAKLPGDIHTRHRHNTRTAMTQHLEFLRFTSNGF